MLETSDEKARNASKGGTVVSLFTLPPDPKFLVLEKDVVYAKTKNSTALWISGNGHPEEPDYVWDKFVGPSNTVQAALKKLCRLPRKWVMNLFLSTQERRVYHWKPETYKKAIEEFFTGKDQNLGLKD